MPDAPTEHAAEIAVIIVAYASADVIGPCVDSLVRQDGGAPRIIVVDNASPDDSAQVVQDIAARTKAPITLLRAPVNRGFAAGVNLGLAHAMTLPGVNLFWLLNPDCVARGDTALAYCRAAALHPGFALMGGRVLYHGTDIVQSDGGRLRPWTAVAENLNQGHSAGQAQPPDQKLDFVSGANLVASRAFVRQAGPMPERYFLYYEEVDWALRRAGMPLVSVPEAQVLHHGGTAAGSGTRGRAPSAFANYFNYRNRLRLAARHRPHALPGAYAYSVAKIGQMLLAGSRAEAWGAFRGLHQMPPSRAIRSRLGVETCRTLFGNPPNRALKPDVRHTR